MTSAEQTVKVLKRKQIKGKNKKKGWKKTDVQEIEEHLEDERLQERTGGLVAEKTDDQLFFVDTTTEEIASEPVSKKTRLQNKKLKCHSILEPQARIKAIYQPTDRSRKIVAPPVDDTISTPKPLPQSKRVAQQQREKARKAKEAARQAVDQLPTSSFDLWADTASEEKIDDYHQKMTKKSRVKVPPKYAVQPTSVPAVEVPKPGASYNPTFDHHQDLLQTAHNVEVAKDNEEKRLEKSLENKAKGLPPAEVQQKWLAEMSQGLFDEEKSEEDGSGSDSDSDIAINAPTRGEDRKTRKQKRKFLEQKEVGRTAKERRGQRKRDHDFNRIKSVVEELEKEELQVTMKTMKTESLKQQRKNLPQKLGKRKYEPANIEIKLSDEIQGSLRKLKPEGSLLEDRFNSLQKRNIIEPRIKARKHRKYPVKYFTKKTHQVDS